MSDLQREIADFLETRDLLAHRARQTAAIQIACHLDLEQALKGDAGTLARVALRLERMLERERIRGSRRHWSYDLNRHIALKQALDRILAAGGKNLVRSRSKADPENANGARRRRSRKGACVHRQ